MPIYCLFFSAILAVLPVPTGCSKPPEKTRQPTAAGSFYPSDAGELHDLVDRLMKVSPPKGVRGVRAVLVPHAGYAYSGAVAAEGFRDVGSDFRRVFLLAANHRGEIDLSGVSLPTETHYAIPGARIPLSEILEELRRQAGFTDEPAVHVMHMIEVELPFLSFLKERSGQSDFEIVPMILGRMDRTAVRRLAEILNRYADDRTLFVFSVDLSHYFPEPEAVRLDQETIRSVMSLDFGGLARATTDGNQVLLTMADLAERRGWEATFMRHQHSGSVSGDSDRVVGYASIVFHDPLSLTDREKSELLRIARFAVGETVRTGREPGPDLLQTSNYPIFNIPRGVFVTLRKNGELRGCIGSLLPEQSFYEGVLKNAARAATEDPRFPPVTGQELDRLSVSISVLGYPRRIEAAALKPREDGVILDYKGRRSTFLPAVWEELPEPVRFLSALCRKQGAPDSCWQDANAVLYRYRAFEFGE